MRVFVTGASGWIGSAVVADLVAAGHEVTGLARSESAAAAVTAAGATALRGSLGEPDRLRAGAEPAEAVIHLGFNHDFSDPAGAGRTERTALETFGEALAGSGRPLLFASGVALLGPARVSTERDAVPHAGPDAPRGGGEELALGFAARGIVPVALRFAPTVHGEGDHGFTAVVAGIARDKGVSAFIGDGSNRWPAVHRTDAARLVRLAAEQAGSVFPAGGVVHAVAEEGVPTRTIADAIGRGLDLPVASIAPDQAMEHFGWMGRFFGTDAPSSSALTQQRLDWTPVGPTLEADLGAGFYTRPV